MTYLSKARLTLEVFTLSMLLSKNYAVLNEGVLTFLASTTISTNTSIFTLFAFSLAPYYQS